MALEQYSIVRIVKLLHPPEAYNGWGINKRNPQVGDTGAILEILTAPGLSDNYVVENSDADGSDIWLADFVAEELEPVLVETSPGR
jgi:hypothetical protein